MVFFWVRFSIIFKFVWLEFYLFRNLDKIKVIRDWIKYVCFILFIYYDVIFRMLKYIDFMWFKLILNFCISYIIRLVRIIENF